MENKKEMEFIKHGKLFSLAFIVYGGIILILAFLCFGIDFPKKLPGTPVLGSGHAAQRLVWKSTENVVFRRNEKVLVRMDNSVMVGSVESPLIEGVMIISITNPDTLDFKKALNNKVIEVTYYQKLVSFLLDKN